MRRAPVAFVAAAGLAFPSAAGACTSTRSFDPRVPTWQAVNHYVLGSRVASNADIRAYLGAVDRASARVRSGIAARSAAGRPLPYAIVGAPAAIAPRRLDAEAARLRELRLGTAAAAVAARIAARDPGFAWVGGSVHGNEPSGADADMHLLYELAARRDCAGEQRLRRLVTFLMPVQNPDGRGAGERTNSAGFDLNRDWFARTQPETAGKVALLERYPPLLFADQHEQSGTSFFVPPNADPVHHEISGHALRAIDSVLAPAVRRALTTHGAKLSSESTYDLFFMGYGDTVPTTLFGAAGMTFEAGGQLPFAERVSQHFVAVDAALTVAARSKTALLRGWAAQWREARADGARGVLRPNRVIGAGDGVRFPVPDDRVYGYVLRGDVHGADAAALVDRLTSVGVEVDRLAGPLTVGALDAYGAPGPAGSATLPAGTFYVPMAQGAKHWVEAILGEDAYVPFPYFYDVTAWSNPLLMGLAGGALRTPLPTGTVVRRVAVGAAAGRGEVAPGAAAYAFESGSEGAAELASALLTRGVAVRRVPGAGTFVVPGGTRAETLSSLARADRVAVQPLEAAPTGAVALRAPRVAMLEQAAGARGWSAVDGGSITGRAITGRAITGGAITGGAITGGSITGRVPASGGGNSGSDVFAAASRGEGPAVQGLSASWARFVLERRLGLSVDRLRPGDVAAGRLASGGYTALVVPDGTAPTGGLSPAALAALGAWVRGGGTLVAWRGQGLGVAEAAGVTAVRRRPGTVSVQGVALRMALDTTDPIAWGEEPFSFAFDAADPVLDAGSARVVGRYPDGSDFFVSGYAAGTEALRGMAAITDEGVGAGRVVLFTFDPCFRAYVEGTERLVANALLAPPGAG